MNYTFTFTEPELNYILNTLGAKPYTEVAGLFAKMDKQIKDQQKPKEESTSEETPQK